MRDFLAPGHADEGLRSLDDDLPPATLFVPVGSSHWCAHPGAPDWLLKQREQVYFHVPSSSLWRRTRTKALVRVDGCGDVRRAAACGFAASTPALLVRSAFVSWAAATVQKWGRWCSDVSVSTDDLSPFDATMESPIAGSDRTASTTDASPENTVRSNLGLQVRRARKGLRHGCRGVSPPPRDGGWKSAAHGWQRHEMAPNWLRKEEQDSDPAYFYLPNESLWAEMPSGQFACVDTYHKALAAMISTSDSSVLRMCLVGWKAQAKIIKQWRYKISVIAGSGGAGQSDELGANMLGSGDDEVTDGDRFAIGDKVTRKGEEAVVVKIDTSMDPPSYIVHMSSDGREVGTEGNLLQRVQAPPSWTVRTAFLPQRRPRGHGSRASSRASSLHSDDTPKEES